MMICVACENATLWGPLSHGFQECLICGLGQLEPAELRQRAETLRGDSICRTAWVEGPNAHAPEDAAERAHKISVFQKVAMGYHAFQGHGDVVDGPAGRCLELGAGNFYMVEGAKLLLWDGAGCDLSMKAVVSAQQRMLNAFPVDLGSWRPPTAMQGAYNLVWAWDVLEHCENLTGAIATLAGLLLRGGIVVIHSPQLSMYSRDAAHSHWHASHLWHLTHAAISRMLGKVGVETLKVEIGTVWGSPGYAHPANFVLWGIKV